MFRLPWQKSATAASSPAASSQASAPAPSEAPGTATNTIHVARQPLFDTHSNVMGYELLFRNSAENRFSATDHEVASGLMIEQSAAAFGFDRLVSDRMAFVNVSRGALLNGYHRILPPGRTVIELLESITADPEVVAACRQMKADGYQLALDDFTNSPEVRPLLEFADIVKVDFRQSTHACEARFVRELRQHGVKLLAEKIETRDEQRRAAEAGYDYFQGYYYCKPEMIQAQDVPPSKLNQLRFLAEVNRDDISFEKLEDIFRQDVGLTMRLLRYLNSAAFGWRHEVPTLGHALSLMGAQPLRKWATMMGLLQLNDGGPPELAVTALARARFAEHIGPAAGVEKQDNELFLTGMLSVVDAMVGRPAREVLSQMAVHPSVTSAVVEGGNELGSVLRMVTAYERGDWKSVEDDPSVRGMSPQALNDAYVDSLQWAEATIAA